MAHSPQLSVQHVTVKNMVQKLLYVYQLGSDNPDQPSYFPQVPTSGGFVAVNQVQNGWPDI